MNTETRSQRYVPPAIPRPLVVIAFIPEAFGVCPYHNPQIPARPSHLPPPVCNCPDDDDHSIDRSEYLSAHTDGAGDRPLPTSTRAHTDGACDRPLPTSTRAHTDGADNRPPRTSARNSGPTLDTDSHRGTPATRISPAGPSTSTPPRSTMPGPAALGSSLDRKPNSQRSRRYKFYAVIRGRRIGVVNSWSEAQALTSGITNGVAEKHYSYEDAYHDYRSAVLRGDAEVIRHKEDTEARWGPEAEAAQPI